MANLTVNPSISISRCFPTDTCCDGKVFKERQPCSLTRELRKLRPKDKAFKIADRDGMYVSVSLLEPSRSDMTTVSMADVKR
jgi:hypothetical protein